MLKSRLITPDIREENWMKIRSCLTIIFVLVLLIDTSVEASFSANLICSLSKQRIYLQCYRLISKFFGRYFLNLFPKPAGLMITDPTRRSDHILVSILENNKNLVLGDVLVDSVGDAFFFMSPSNGDEVISTLMRAETGLYANSHKINEYTLISRFDQSEIRYLDYLKDIMVNDRFKVIKQYGEHVLLGSARQSIVFVAPIASIDQYLRKEFQAKVKERHERDDRKNAAEKRTILENMRVDPTPNFRIFNIYGGANFHLTAKQNFQIKSNESKNDADFLVSPDSVAFGAHLSLRKKQISNIEKLLAQLEGPTQFRIPFIKNCLIPIFLETQINVVDAIILVQSAEQIFAREQLIGNINIEEGQFLTVVGDIHGQFLDLLRIFQICGWPSDKKKYLFNGDIVDRGRESVECLLFLYALKIAFPQYVFINRGNHESEMCSPGTFKSDAMKLDETGTFFRTCQKGFCALPLAHVINNRIYVVHGGGIRKDLSVKNFSGLNRFQPTEYVKSFMVSSMWDDASEEFGINPNACRGSSSCFFGPDVTESFLKANGFDLIIRSHSFVPKGIEISQGGKCWTLFSAPNYGGLGNTAAVVTFDTELVSEFEFFDPK